MWELTEPAAITPGLSLFSPLWGSIPPALAFVDDLFAIGLVLGLILPCLIWGAWRLLQSGMSAGQARPPATHRCPECRLRLVAAGDECPRCGAGGDNTLTPPARALSRLHRNVAWLERRGILPAHISQRLLATLASELQILHVPPPVLPPAAPGPLGLSPAAPATAGPLTTTEPGSLGLTAPVSVLHDLPGSTTVVDPLPESRDPQAKAVVPVARVTPPPDPRPTATTTPARSPVADSRSATPESPAVASPTEEPLWLEVVDSETESRTKPLLERVADEHRERPRAQPPAVPSDKGTPVASAKPSAKPEWSDWLLAFMEQRNLNWGELIGGLMILSGSLALVFSFWNEIAGRPLLKFCVFNGFTAGLFAAGRYALSRLQLPSTARALYAIGTLLVPLNLLAMASFSRGDAATSPLLLMGELLSVALFAWLLFRAGGVLSPEAPARLAWGVLGPALACLLIARLDLPHGARWLPLVLGLWPAALYVGANLWRLPARSVLPATGDTPGGLTTTPTGVPHVADPATQAPSPPATAWWRLATTSFATLLPLGLLLARGTSEQARTLAPLFPLLAAPSLGLALACSRKNSPQRSDWTRLLAWLAGFPALAFMVGGLLLSWPSVWPCLLTIATMTAVLTWLSARERAAGLWLLSLPGVLLGWLLLLGLLRRQIDWHTTDPDLLGEVLLDPWNPLALLPLVGLLLAGSRTARVVGSPLSKGMQLGGALIGLFSLVHTCGTSLGKAGDPGWGSLVLLLYGVGGWLVAERATPRDPSANSPSEGAALSPGRQRPQPAVRPSHAAHQATGPVAFHAAQVALGLLSVWLLVVGSWQLVVVRFPTRLPPHASLVPLLAAGLLLVVPPWRRALPNTAQAPSQPPGLEWLRTVCVAGLTALAVWGGFLAWAWGARQWLPLHGLACAGAWFVLAWRQRRSNSAGSLWFGAAQILTALSSGLALTQFLTNRAWAGRIQPEPFDPVVWQWGGTAAGLQCLLWLGLRACVARRPHDPVADSSPLGSFRGDLAALMHAPAGLGDRWLTAGLSGVLLLLAGYAVFPGAARELTPRQQANSWTPASAKEVAAPAATPARDPAPDQTTAATVAAQPSVPPRLVPPLSAYELPEIPHVRASGRGMWAWWGVLVLVSLGWQWWAPSRLHGGLLLSTLAAAAPLCAVAWEGDVASASALRWLLTAGIALTAVSAWCLSARPSPGPLSNSLLDRCVRPFAEEWVTLAMLFKLACLIGFALIVGVLLTTPPAGPFLSTSDLTLGLAVAGCGLVVGLLIQLDVFRPLRTTDDTTRAAEGENHSVSPLSTGSQLPQAGASANSLPLAGTPSGLDHSVWAGLVWLVGLGPLVVMTLFGIAQALRGNPLLGPEPGSLFHALGQALNYAIPLTAWGLVLAGQAYCFRRTTPLFLSGLLFQAATTLAVLFTAARGGRTLDAALWSELLCWNSLVASLLAVLWWWQRARFEGPASQDLTAAHAQPGQPSALLLTQTLFGPVLWGLALLPVLHEAWLSRFFGPASASLAGGVGTVSCGAALLALWAWARSDQWVDRWPAWRTCLAGGVAVWLGTQFGRLGPEWLAPVNHWQVLALLLTLGTVALWLVQWHRARLAATALENVLPFSASEPIALGVLACLASLWHGQPGCTWPNTTVSLVLGGLCLAHAAVWGDRSRSWGTVALWCLAQVVFETFARQVPAIELLLEPHPWSLPTRMLLVAAIPAAISVAIRPRATPGELGPAAPPGGFSSLLREPARVVGSVGLLLLVFNIGSELFWWHGGLTDVTAFTRLALPMALVAAWVATLFDGTRARSVPPIYLSGWGLAWVFATQGHGSVGLTCDRLLSAQAVLTGCCGLLWLRRADVDVVARWLGVNPVSRNGEANRDWLRRATGFVSLAVLVLAFFRVGDRSFQAASLVERLFTLGLPLAALIPVGLLAGLSRPSNDLKLRGQVLRRGAWVCVLAGWSLVALSGLFTTSGRYTLWWTIPLVMLTAYQAALLIVARHCTGGWAEWQVAISRLLRWLPGVALLLHLLVVAFHPAGREPWGPASVLATALLLISLLLMAVGSLLVAARASFCPFSLSDRNRRWLVFLAEAFLALLFWQLRNSFPELFQRFAAYWPVAVMGLSFAGLGMSELLRRRDRAVLAEPVEQTALALPLLPLLGYWLSPSVGASGVSLLLGGLLYGSLSHRRGSLWLALAALVTTTGAIWVPLAEIEACSPWRHPQLWLIPPALGLLLAGWLHREQLTPAQAGTLRYIGALTIYLSSTFDIFLNGLATAPWLAVVLCGLSVLGMLLGMLLRVRGFLFLGLGFLLLSLSSMVWHAAVNLHQTWTVWLAVVVLGVAVLALFALFERRRSQVEGLLRDLRDWSV